MRRLNGWTHVLAASVLMMAACSSDDESASAPDTGGTADTAGTTDTGQLDDTGGTDGSSDVMADATTGDTQDDAQEDSSDTTAAPTCGTDSTAALVACVDTAKIEADIQAMVGTRVAGMAHHKVVQDYCATRLEELGYTVERQNYRPGTNVIGRKTGKTQPDHHVVIGAHYDSEPDCPSADDNASGVAGALELARVLAMTEHDRSIVVACWDEEELGLKGASAWLRTAVAAGERIVANYTFEMIGYYSDEPNSQELPAGFEVLFPQAVAAVEANEFRGDFIGLIGDESSATYLGRIEAWSATLGMPTLRAVVATALLELSQISALRRSDHAPFWDERIPAIMITDTANFRNKAYHCGAGQDTLESLDLARATKVVAATTAAVIETLVAGDAAEGSTGQAPPCTFENDACSEGQHCALALSTHGKWSTTCVSDVDTPVQKGGECVRPNNTVGEDNCAEGLFCAFWGLPKGDPQKRHCLSVCTSDAACGEGERCARLSVNAVRDGVCVPTCDPFDSDACGDGVACRYWQQSFPDGAPLFTCHWEGPVAEGAVCTPELGTECVAGLSCVLSTVDGQAACRAPCDDTHPCSAGFTCRPDRNQDASGTEGFCQPD